MNEVLNVLVHALIYGVFGYLVLISIVLLYIIIVELIDELKKKEDE